MFNMQLHTLQPTTTTTNLTINIQLYTRQLETVPARRACEGSPLAPLKAGRAFADAARGAISQG
jgi:hypothetical protein